LPETDRDNFMVHLVNHGFRHLVAYHVHGTPSVNDIRWVKAGRWNASASS